jgi:hypothetical protein
VNVGAASALRSPSASHRVSGGGSRHNSVSGRVGLESGMEAGPVPATRHDPHHNDDNDELDAALTVARAALTLGARSMRHRVAAAAAAAAAATTLDHGAPARTEAPPAEGVIDVIPRRRAAEAEAAAGLGAAAREEEWTRRDLVQTEGEGRLALMRLQLLAFHTSASALLSAVSRSSRVL